MRLPPKSIVSCGYPGAGKGVRQQKAGGLRLPGRNLSLTVDADPQAEISSKETLAENLTSLTLSNGARVILAKSAGEEQKLQIIAVSNKGDLSFPAQQNHLSRWQIKQLAEAALANSPLPA